MFILCSVINNIVKMKVLAVIFFIVMTIVTVLALPKSQRVIGVAPVVAVRPVVVAPAQVAVVRPVVVAPVLGVGKLGHVHGHGHGPRLH